jgi:hypothetical protein
MPSDSSHAASGSVRRARRSLSVLVDAVIHPGTLGITCAGRWPVRGLHNDEAQELDDSALGRIPAM